jgi:hypothetical protein
MSTPELIPTTQDERFAYKRDASAFIKSTGWYQDSRSTAVCAVMEYMAFLDGKTVRESLE